MLDVIVVETSELGDRSYVAHDGQIAIVIDPQRDIDRVQQVVASNGVRVVAVAETHIHNDYVSGGLELARVSAADYLICSADPVAFDRVSVADGDVRSYGALEIQVIATPGHTHTHLSFAVSDPREPDRVAVFTGGSLLFGSVGRTDLLGAEHTVKLTRDQFHSARKLIDLLPASAEVFPTHGFGSFCSSGSATGGEGSTLGAEQARNDALTETDEDTFVNRLISNLTAYPAYYAHMGARNLAGPAAPDLSPPERVNAEELRARVEAGEWVVDLRDRTVYPAGHVPGTISIELGQQFATYLGWLIPWGTPLTVIGKSEQEVADAQRQLVRIGIERLDGANLEGVAQLTDTPESYPSQKFVDLAAAFGSADPATKQVILDVRRDDERAVDHIPESVHIPMHGLLARMAEVPTGTLWVHCAAGFRASIAASLLARAGHDVVLVDDDFARAQAMGLTHSSKQPA